MDEEKDLKEVEEDTTQDTGQSEETPESEVKTEDTETISKSELEQLRKDANEKDNYRKAVIRLNRSKGRSLPESEPEKKPVDEFDEPKENFVTKQDLIKREEKSIVNKACENPEIDENWDEIIVYYTPSRDDSYEGKLASIMRAHKLWSLDKKLEEVPKSQEKAITQDLATDKGLSKGKEKVPEVPEKTLFPKVEKMETWYK